MKKTKEKDLATPEPGTVKRVSVDFDYSALNPHFVKGLARIAGYASVKYGSALQYMNARLVGEKSPVNHALEHLRAYQCGEPHDKFGDLDMQLVAAGYNVMMEYGYLQKFGHLPHPLDPRKA